MIRMEKAYEPQKVEDRIYKLWEKSGFFDPDNLPKRHKKPFTILMPPPNANDPLHIGHAVMVTLEDIMIRYQRMRGMRTLWLPGMDHAGFETQVVFEKKLEKQSRSRLDMTRKEFSKEVWEYTQNNRKIARNQLKKLGASCDWSRETFTLDKHIVETVNRTFKDMADAGLVYRGERLVNYCTKHRTAFSNLEVAHEKRNEPLYHIKYGPLELATVRPETKFGDTGVAVHPSDERYKQYIGKTIEIDTLLGKKTIKVISDKYVDPEFGTGVVKVTPAHDPNDYEIWKRHEKEITGPVQVIGQNGRMTEHAGPYEGLKVKEARERIAQDMQEKGLITKVDEDYEHTVSLCYKCKNVLEPMLLKQWFIATEPLAKKAMEAVRSKEVRIMPLPEEKKFFHWMKNIRDWNISRQIWWGIPIPAWKCTSCEKEGKESWMITEGKKPSSCDKCGKKQLVQDTDVFDTWFSSGQWPFATLGYPDHKDYKTFYPTSVMETGYDILFFWVARMIMLGIWRTKKPPFSLVYLHGLVRDKDRQKMSKSKGNVINPLGVAEQYGTDAVRMALTVGNNPGKDIVVSEDKVRGYRNFANKLWNMTRFVLMNTEDYDPKAKVKETRSDKKIRSDLKKASKKVTRHMERYRFSQAAEEAYHYAWHTLADISLEESKPALQDPNLRASRQKVLIEVLSDTLKMLHPFVPYVTEELYQKLPLNDREKTIMIEKWPD